MFVPFENLPATARIWVYPSNRKFTDEETEKIGTLCRSFLEQWTAHGQGLKASFSLPYNQFIVIALDEAQHAASGCSIDASVHFIQDLELQFAIVLLDKMNVTFKQGAYVSYKDLKAFRAMVKNKAVSSNTIVFNNLVATKEEYEQSWELPASESWHQRFF